MQRVKRIGGSLMVRIPKDVVDRLGVREGDTIYFEPKKRATTHYGDFPDLAGWRKDADAQSKYT